MLVADLSSAQAAVRWPMFAPAAVRAWGARGMFCFPLGLGAAQLGVLSVYREKPGPLEAGQLADGLGFADAILALALDTRGDATTELDQVIDTAFTLRRAEVHQATGNGRGRPGGECR